jgi:triosephosphate isomerase
MKKKLYAANWKLHKSPNETQSFFQNLATSLKSFGVKCDSVEILICPPALCISSAANTLLDIKKNTPNNDLNKLEIKLGLQNSYSESKGAFTGENSAEVAKAMGVEFVLVGHSERRTLFKENNELINKKLKLLFGLDLKPILCIGETLEERDKGLTNSVLKSQLVEAFSGLTDLPLLSEKLVVAYEPVWAIGTGRVASTDQVAEAHRFIYEVLKEYGFTDKVRIQYGGSVKPENAGQLIQIPHVDGFLIGGASLEVESFVKIIFN